MMNAAAMAAEERRINSVRSLRLMDTEPEEEFDELARLAAAVCEVPMSAVTLIDDKRQYLKALHGPLARETSREESFCRFALDQHELLEVPDAREDARFRDNPSVTAANGVRFYAGMPLTMPDGSVVGTLCVVDSVPRELTEAQRDSLATLARQAVERMELRQQKFALEEALAALMKMQAELKIANQQLERESLTDALTGLANRRAFDEALRRETARSLRHGSALSVVMMDIDNFKRHNDRYGHVHGDAVLRRIGELLRHSVRLDDTAARYGGEEFVLLLPETGSAGAVHTAERICNAMHAIAWDKEPVTLSLGVATLGKEASDKSMLVELADMALYEAKHNGKDRVVASGATRKA
jgi:diguanylate cyclase (GGDEF)-like protein